MIKTPSTCTLERVNSDYSQLRQNSHQFSICAMLGKEGSALLDYCRLFTPHPESERLTTLTQRYCQQRGFWLPNARHHVTCELFLYPDAHFDLLLTMMKHLCIDFYLNDIMGRDVFRSLDTAGRQRAAALINRMASVDERLDLPAGAQPIEIANIELLRDMKAKAPAAWFRYFLKLYNKHLWITHRDNNAAGTGRIPSLGEYIDARMHTSGMIFMVLLIEFADSNFLDWDWLEQEGIAGDLRRLHYVTAAFGCLSNDLFSFEKEVIDNGADANLVMVLGLNAPGTGLAEMLGEAGLMVRDLLIEYFALLSRLKNWQLTLLASGHQRAGCMERHIRGVERCLQASWMWQVHTERYKREHSLFRETDLVGQVHIAV